MNDTANPASRSAQSDLFAMPPGHMAWLATYEDDEPDAWDDLLAERAAYLADESARDDARPVPPIEAHPAMLDTRRDRGLVVGVAMKLRAERARDLSDAEIDRCLSGCALTSLPAFARRYRDAGALSLAPTPTE